MMDSPTSTGAAGPEVNDAKLDKLTRKYPIPTLIEAAKWCRSDVYPVYPYPQSWGVLFVEINRWAGIASKDRDWCREQRIAEHRHYMDAKARGDVE